MKKIIDGKMYDTDKAELVAEWSNNFGPSDFRCYAERLYRTAKGSWFLYCAGGALSPAAESDGNVSGWGEHLTPVTPEEAFVWMQKYDKIEAIGKYFADKVADA